MRAMVGLLFLLAQPFWETTPPEQWTEQEVESVLGGSPWGQTVGPSPEVQVYLATAAPVEAAEAELRRRGRRPAPTLDPDYTDYVRDNRSQNLVVAVGYGQPVRFGSEADQKRMEDECRMVVGKKSYPMVGHFPPTPSDPVLRLIFPRAAGAGDKSVVFRLYLPGVSFPEREVEFRVKDMMVRGKLEM